MKTLALWERNWMPKFEACSRIRKRLDTIWIFPYIFMLSVFWFSLRRWQTTLFVPYTLRHIRFLHIWCNLNNDRSAAILNASRELLRPEFISSIKLIDVHLAIGLFRALGALSSTAEYIIISLGYLISEIWCLADVSSVSPSSSQTESGLTLETSVKHHIPQAKNIPYQPLLINPIFSVLAHAEKQGFFQN